MRKVHSRLKIYKNRLHIWITFFALLIPFVLMLSFAHSAGIGISDLFEDFGASIIRLIAAYAIAASVGWVLATFFFEGKRATIALPLFDILQSFPMFAALPLFVFFFGISSVTVIFFLVFTIIWPIIFSILGSLKLLKHDWREAVTMSGLRGWNYVRYFLWPVSVPGLITGSIIGIGEAWESLIATEIIVKLPYGLGNFFQRYTHSFISTAFGMLGFLILIFCINKFIWLPLLNWSHAKVEE